MYFKIKRIGQNLIVVEDSKAPYTITLPKDYNFDKIFSLAYRANNQIKVAETLLLKELKKFEKPKAVDSKIIETRIEKKKLEKKIKSIQSFDYTKLDVYLPENWIQVLASKEDNQYLKNFLMLLSLNKSEWTRNNFLKQFSTKYPYITDLGFLVSVRQVYKVQKLDELYDFITSQYFKIKGWKKSTKNYFIGDTAFGYHLFKNEEDGSKIIGNLDTLYNTYEPTAKSVYCSAYNKGKVNQESWNLGEVITISDPAYDDNEICGHARYHIKTDPFSCVGNKEYGDTNLVTIVNPSKILGIREDWKYTTSEVFLAAEITDEEIKESFKEDFGHFSADYAQINFDEVKELVKEKQNNNVISHKSAQKQKVSELKNQIKDLVITKNITSEDFGKILENRISLITK